MIENATGGSANDAIVANAADNIQTGGGGDDTFIFIQGTGSYDTITDWGNGDDLVDLSDFGRIRLGDVSVERSIDGIEFTVFDQTVFFDGAQRGDLSLSDFVL